MVRAQSQPTPASCTQLQDRRGNQHPHDPNLAAEEPCHNVDLTLRAGACAAGHARQVVRAMLGSWHVDDNILDVCCLITSELVTNGVVHAEGDILFHLDQRPPVDDRPRRGNDVNEDPPQERPLAVRWDLVADGSGEAQQSSSGGLLLPRLSVVRIAVSDGTAIQDSGTGLVAVSEQELALRARADQPDLSESGRGLLLVAALADSWEVQTRSHGKRVVVTVGLRGSAELHIAPQVA